MIRRPPRSPLFPSTTLSRSGRGHAGARQPVGSPAGPRPPVPAGGRLLGDPRGGRARLDTFPPREGRGEAGGAGRLMRSEEHTSELQSLAYLVCRLLL